VDNKFFIVTSLEATLYRRLEHHNNHTREALKMCVDTIHYGSQ